MTPLVKLASRYVQARHKAETLRASNDAASLSISGIVGPDRPSGKLHSTPIEVIDAVSAWKKAAIDLAEHVSRMVLRP